MNLWLALSRFRSKAFATAPDAEDPAPTDAPTAATERPAADPMPSPATHEPHGPYVAAERSLAIQAARTELWDEWLRRTAELQPGGKR